MEPLTIEDAINSLHPSAAVSTREINHYFQELALEGANSLYAIHSIAVLESMKLSHIRRAVPDQTAADHVNRVAGIIASTMDPPITVSDVHDYCVVDAIARLHDLPEDAGDARKGALVSIAAAMPGPNEEGSESTWRRDSVRDLATSMSSSFGALRAMKGGEGFSDADRDLLGRVYNGVYRMTRRSSQSYVAYIQRLLANSQFDNRLTSPGQYFDALIPKLADRIDNTRQLFPVAADGVSPEYDAAAVFFADAVSTDAYYWLLTLTEEQRGNRRDVKSAVNGLYESEFSHIRAKYLEATQAVESEPGAKVFSDYGRYSNSLKTWLVLEATAYELHRDTRRTKHLTTPWLRRNTQRLWNECAKALVDSLDMMATYSIACSDFQPFHVWDVENRLDAYFDLDESRQFTPNETFRGPRALEPYHNFSSRMLKIMDKDPDMRNSWQTNHRDQYRDIAILRRVIINQLKAYQATGEPTYTEGLLQL